MMNSANNKKEMENIQPDCDGLKSSKSFRITSTALNEPGMGRNRGTLYILTGIPGSGKSTAGKKYGQLYSSDAVRKELFGDSALQYELHALARWIIRNQLSGETNGFESEYNSSETETSYRSNKSESTAYKKLEAMPDEKLCQLGHKMVFGVLDQKVSQALSQGKTVVYDATNLMKSQRHMLIQKFSPLCAHIYSIYVDTPLDLALKRNAQRKRQVPEYVVQAMQDSLEKPELSEGFDDIIVIHPESSISSADG